MKQLISVPFERVKKGEFPGLVTKIINIIGKYNTSQFKELYNKLLSLESKTQKLEVDNRKHTNTQELKLQKDILNKVVAGMKKHSKTVDATITESKINDAKIALPVLQRFLNNYIKVSPLSKLERMSQMLALIDSDETLRNSLYELNFDYHLTRIREITDQINLLDTERTAESSSKPKQKDTLEAIKLLTVSIRQLFNGIENAIYLHPEHDFTAMVKELNTAMGFYSTPIKAKQTRSKNVANQTKDASEKEKHTEDVQGATSIHINSAE